MDVMLGRREFLRVIGAGAVFGGAVIGNGEGSVAASDDGEQATAKKKISGRVTLPIGWL
jgi:hypothetical protein